VTKVLGVVGSARKNGNTQILVQGILDGAKLAGAEVEILLLAGIELKDCDGCHACWRGNSCAKGDDMNDLYRKISESDVIVFGTPVYWYGPSGLMKCFLDRFVYFNCPTNRPQIKGKGVILAIPFEESDLGTAGPLVEMFQRSIRFLEMRHLGTILVPGVTIKGEVRKKDDVMKTASQLGREAAQFRAAH
jgi:NAD(P)H-dependent FMN reductase